MLVRLHSQATTTPKIRAAIKASADPAWMVGERYGISEQTVLKWRQRRRPQSHTTSLADDAHASAGGCCGGVA